MKIKDAFRTKLVNYYGSVIVFYDEETKKYYMGLGNWNGLNKIEISVDLYAQISNELGTMIEEGDDYDF
ncbi:MAG: hypothetical protein ACRCX7_11430 [Cetobacterium sp.]|uniref:hypothetical protein n=1 Tax=Cetobacterium sp. TaxID=2071632 RepID=UPI003F30EAFF